MDVIGSYERHEHSIAALIVSRGGKFWVQARDTGHSWEAGAFDSESEAWGYIDSWLGNSWGLKR